MVAAVFWDNDGVLVDTEAIFYRATRDTLRRVGVELDEATFTEYSLGRGKNLFEVAMGGEVSRARIEELRAQRNDVYAEMLSEGADVLPGVRECLDQLSGRHRMAIVTSSLRRHFDLIHANTDLLPYFEMVLTSEDYRKHKPDPEPYVEAARRLGVAAADCVAVEDSERGVASAKAAGMRCIAVPHRLSRQGRLDPADQIVESAHSIPERLAAWAR